MARHPFFDQPSQWHTTIDSALARAAVGKSDDGGSANGKAKAIFVVVGAERCVATRAFVEKTLCKDEVVELLEDGFIPVSVVALEDPMLAAWQATLPKREPTPVCLYLSPRGALLLSTVGGRPPAVLMNDMMQATRLLRAEP